MYDSNFYSLFTKLCNDQWCLIPECFPHGEETLHPSAVTFPSSLPWESLGPLSQSLDLPILDTSYNCNYMVVPFRVRLLSLYRNVFKVHPCCGASLVAQTVKNLPAMQETFPELGRSPGEGSSNPLQYSCLENPMDRGAWRATVQGVTTLIRLSD